METRKESLDQSFIRPLEFQRLWKAPAPFLAQRLQLHGRESYEWKSFLEASKGLLGFPADYGFYPPHHPRCRPGIVSSLSTEGWIAMSGSRSYAMKVSERILNWDTFESCPVRKLKNSLGFTGPYPAFWFSISVDPKSR